MYRERPSRLPGTVIRQRLTTAEDVRILPDGGMDLIWSAAGELLVAGPGSTPSPPRPG